MAETENHEPAKDTATATEIARLKQDYASRMAADRPLSHSVATAYRQLIAQFERRNSDTCDTR